MKPSLKEQLETVRAELGVPALGALVGDSRSVRAFASVGVRRAGTEDPIRFYLCAANWGHADATNAVLTLIQSLSTQAV